MVSFKKKACRIYHTKLEFKFINYKAPLWCSLHEFLPFQVQLSYYWTIIPICTSMNVWFSVDIEYLLKTEWFEIHEPSIMKHWPWEARIFKAWTLYYITLTLCSTILSCTCFFIPQNSCISRPYCMENPRSTFGWIFRTTIFYNKNVTF